MATLLPPSSLMEDSERPGGEEILKLLLQADPAAPGDPVQWICRERSLQGSRATWIQSISRENRSACRNLSPSE